MTTAPKPPLLTKHFDPSVCIDGRCGKDLDPSQYAYAVKLADGTKFEGATFGLNVAFTNDLVIDENRMSVRFPYASGQRRDGVGDVLRIEGIDTERHVKNPLVLFDHGKSISLPFGKSEDPDTGEYTNYIDVVNQTAEVVAFIYQGKGIAGVEATREYDHALFCQQLFDMMAKKFVRGGSIGYQVIEGIPMAADYQDGIPPGLDLRRVRMLEASAVVMPANMDTVGKALCKGFRCCGKPLSPYLVKSLAPFAPERKAMVSVDKNVKSDEARDSGGRFATVGEGIGKLKRGQRVAVVEGPKTHQGIRNVYKVRGEGGEEEYVHESRMQMDKSTPVPLAGDLSKTDYQPAKWKPGLGAEKTLIDITDSRFVGKKTDAERAARGAGYKQGVLTWSPSMREISARQDMGWADDDEEQIGTFTQDGKSMKSTPVPLTGDLSKTDYQPAKWKPGLGAEKGLVPAQDVRPGDIFKDDDGSEWKIVKVRRRDGKWEIEHEGGVIQYQDGAQVPIVGPSRGSRTKTLIKSLRQKYRPAKGLRHVNRKSSDGSSTFHVRDKDIASAQRDAEGKGIEFRRLGSPAKGLEKVRLTGGDKAIGEIARTYGRKFKKALGATTKMLKPTFEVVPWVDDDGKDIFMIVGTWQGQRGYSYRNTRSEAESKARSYLSNWLERGGDPLFYMDSEPVGHKKSINPKGKLMKIKMLAHATKELPDEEEKDALDDQADAADMPEETETDDEGGEDNEAGLPDGVTPDEENVEEKYSLQVLRAVHSDLTTLLEKYDEMRGPLEHEEIDAMLVDKLSAIVEEIEELEALCEKHHPDAEPLGKGTGDEVVEADSGEMPEESEDEAVEGMQSEGKNLRMRNKASAQFEILHNGTKITDAVDMDDATSRCEAMEQQSGYTNLTIRRKSDGRTWQWNESGKSMKSKQSHKHLCAACGRKDASELGNEEQDREGVDFKPEHIPGSSGMEEESDSPGMEGVSPAAETNLAEEESQKGFQSHHKSSILGASGFLGEASKSADWSDDHRMKAYHHGESLMGVAKAFGAMDDADSGVGLQEPDAYSGYKAIHDEQYVNGAEAQRLGDPSSANPYHRGTSDYDMWNYGWNDAKNGKVDKRFKSTECTSGQAMPDDSQINPIAGVVEDALTSHVKMCMGAGKYLHNLAHEKAFGDSHRQKAAYWHKALADIGGEAAEQVDVQEPSGNPQDVPNDPGSVGSMGEKYAQGRCQKCGAKLNPATEDRICTACLREGKSMPRKSLPEQFAAQSDDILKLTGKAAQVGNRLNGLLEKLR